MHSTLSKEAELVLAAANRATGDPVLRALASRDLDWGTVFDISVSEGAQPALAGRLLSCDGLTLPAGVAAELERVTRITQLRMEYLRRRLNELLVDFARAGISVMLLKGAALAHWAYDSFGQRYMSDLDLLVRPEHAEKAHALLRSTGWELRFKAQYDHFYRDMHHLMPLVDGRAPAMKLNAEIHTSLVPWNRDPFLLDIDDLWRDARRLDDLPGQVFVPSPMHALWHACVHYAWSHMFSRGVRTFQDVAAIVRRGAIDWNAFALEVTRTRAATCCYWTLLLSRRFGSVMVPEEILQQLAPRIPAVLHHIILRHLEVEIITGHSICPSVRLRRLMWRAAIQPARSGHGANRPWSDIDWNEMLADHPGEADARLDHMPSSRNPVAWMRYVQSLVARNVRGQSAAQRALSENRVSAQ